MARETIVRLLDDLDGSEAQETVKFGLRGVDYEIDLNPKNAAALEKALAKYVEAGHRVAAPRARTRSGPGRGGAGAKADVGAIRAWARENGFTVSDRGRIPSEAREAYEAASN